VYARRRRLENKVAPGRSRKDSLQPRALSASERQRVLDTLHSEAFCDQPPVEVYESLLEQGQYLCSVSTMHRLLCAARENGERRQQRPAAIVMSI